MPTVPDIHRRGTRAAQAAATALTIGTLWFVTDEGVTERWTGTVWESWSADPTGPVPYFDLTEGVPVDPPVDTARLYALDVNGYTQVEMRTAAAKVIRFASDNVLIGKVTEPAGVTRGACLYLAGATGANPLVRLARSDDIATMPTIGLALDAGVLNGFIRVLLSGTLALLDTSAFVEGDALFVSPTTAGAMVTALPIAPAYAQRVGFVTRSHATQGEMLVLTTGVVTPPRLHAPTHQAAGTDPLALDTLAAPTDITTLNASSSAHGLLPKLSGVATDVLTGTGTWSAPAGGGAPAAHATTHDTGGADPITALAGSVITTGTVASARLPPRIGALGLVIDGGASVITTGLKGFLEVPFAGTITAVTLLSTDASVTSGSIVVDIWKDAYAAYPPVVGDSITASAKPTLSSATKSRDTALTGWTTSLAAGDILGFSVDSVATLTRVTLSLTVQAT